MHGHEEEYCSFFFGEMHFDFIKVDYCGERKLKLVERERYELIRRAIDRAKPGVRMDICRWTFPGEWAARIAWAWRAILPLRRRRRTPPVDDYDEI